MPQDPNKLIQFWQELKRRKVVRVITVYAATSFVILELVSIIVEPLKLPEWLLPVVIVLLCIGFIIAIILSWIYDIRPEGGVVKTEPASKVKKADKLVSSKSWRTASYISFVVIVGLIIFNIAPRINRSEDISNLEKSIAVLAFSNMSNEPDQDYFSDGISEEILNSLVKVEGIKVAGRTSSFSFKGKDTDIQTIGNKLGVSMVLEGSVRKSENRVRITVQLISVANGFHIWSEQYDSPLKDIFSIQEDIAANIVRKLKLTVLRPKGPQQPTNNLESHNLYLKARYFQNTRSMEGLAKSVEYYQEAIHLDKDYAIAYSGLANSYALQVFYGYVTIHENLSKAKEAAAKSLELNDKLSEVHFSLGMVNLLEDDLYSAEQEFKLSILLNPNNADAHHGYSAILLEFGKTEEAIKEAKIALELDPVNPVMMRGLGKAYYYGRQYDLAIIECNKCLEIDSDQMGAYNWLFFSYCQNAMFDDAISTLERNLIFRRLEDIATLVRQTYEESGFNIAIRQLLDVSLEKSIGFGSSPVRRSLLYAAIGDTDKAIEWCEQYSGNNLKIDPIYDSLRSDPRFQDIMERMKFPE